MPEEQPTPESTPAPVITIAPASTTNTPPVVTQTFTAEDLAKVRKEEKDKLYPRIETMEAELKALRAEREEREKAEQAALQAAADAAKKALEEEMSFKELLQTKDNEWQQKFQMLEQERAKDAALLEQERKFASLQAYRAERMEAVADEIMPELRDLVTGNTPEEVETSIATMIARTSAILNNVTAAQQQQRAGMRGVTPTAPASGPTDTDPTYQTITDADIKNMSMSDYAKYRTRLLGAASDRNQGLFG